MKLWKRKPPPCEYHDNPLMFNAPDEMQHFFQGECTCDKRTGRKQMEINHEAISAMRELAAKFNKKAYLTIQENNYSEDESAFIKSRAAAQAWSEAADLVTEYASDFQ